MADNEDTPTPAAAPKPPARRAPRKSSTAKSASSTPADKPASKPRRKPAASASEAAAATPAKKPAAPPKPRSTKRATPAPKRPAKPKSAAAAEAEKAPVWKNKAAIAGGLAAVGAAATAALLSLRGSTPKKDAAKADDSTTKDEGSAKPTDTGAKAHMPDGTDASKSFEAGIADENIIPEEK
ncbi:hypothetical protein [Sphingomonas jeddahensis]|uniref:Uncharacterized protein n=1 Tax=Sphingomonas jeddahensis TaxID=1915074 RepID=A0A1V2EUQ0_9SPHN|nr:hypothetical protein [Sphingomonas jeddahensis]ONF96310.1 hypothetical protein SPHI_15390 [Sphingomonas jeddahensis]